MTHFFSVAVYLVWIDNDLLSVLVQRLSLLVDILDIPVDFGVLLDLVLLLLVLQLRCWVLVSLAAVPAVLVLHSGLLGSALVILHALRLVEHATQSPIAPAAHRLVSCVGWWFASSAVLSLSIDLVLK